MPFKDPSKRKEYIRAYNKRNHAKVRIWQKRYEAKLKANSPLRNKHLAKVKEYNKSHRKEYNRWRESNKLILAPKAREKYLRKTYKLSLVKYDKMLTKQKGVCYICKRKETHRIHGKPSALCIDHNHTTGKVRKLLCHACNMLIGRVENTPIELKKLLKIIKAYVELD